MKFAAGRIIVSDEGKLNAGVHDGVSAHDLNLAAKKL